MTTPTTPHPTTKSLGIWTCTALVIGNMIGSGIFLLPASLATYGSISMFGWLFTSVGAILVALVFARLARMIPRAGGPYTYSRQGFGDFIGFLIAWGYWISLMCGNAAIAVAMVSYAGVFWPALSNSSGVAAAVAGGAVWLLTIVNVMGVKMAGRVQVVTTVLKLIPLILVATVGYAFFHPGNFVPLNVSGESNFAAITATATLTLWAFLGLESATIPAGDVIDPERTIPKATVLGTIFTAVLYILATAAVMGIIAPADLVASTAPFADAAQRMLGPWAAYFVAAGAAVSCFGALNGWILNQGQIPLAAARDGLFPKPFAKVGRSGAPNTALIISSIFVTILLATNFTRGLVGLFTFIILLATLTSLIPFVFAAAAQLIIFIREKKRFEGQRLTGASIVAVLAFLYSLWAVGGSGQETVYWGFLLLLAGIPVYVWIVWRRAKSEE